MQAANDPELRKRLRSYLCAYWLRPENAVWRVMDWMAIKDFVFEKPMVDLACGDGINSFIMMGGDLPLTWDDSMETRPVTPEEYFAGVDIYNYSDQSRRPEVAISPPPKIFDLGVDWKEDLVDKAKLMKAHEAYLVHDLNNPLPLEAESFATVFSNSIYWVKNVEGLLREIRRVLKPGGRFLGLLTNNNMHNFMFYQQYLATGNKIFDYLDRGRFQHSHHKVGEEEWRQLFAGAGLKVNRMIPYISRRMVEIQEVGLRPIAPVLIKMANSLAPAKRQEIKKEWIDYFEYLVLPMLDGYLNDATQEQCYFAIEAVKE
jgi:SAM-dependent methyltransferase